VWLITYTLVVVFFQDSDSKIAYGILCGWWSSLYVGYIFDIRFKTEVVPLVVYALVGTLTTYLALSWIYRDWPSTRITDRMLLVVVDSIFFLSPIAVNSIVYFLKKKYVPVSSYADSPESLS
jgi:hypothetical protein